MISSFLNKVVSLLGASTIWAVTVAVAQNTEPLRDKPDLANPQEINLALVAATSTSFVSGHETIAALNDGFDPQHSDDKSRGAYGNWPRSGLQWVQYEWSQPVCTRKIAVYWFDDSRGVRLPIACRIKYWNGNDFVAVNNAQGLGLAKNVFNTTTFDEITTTKLRLEMDSNEKFSTGLLEWRVYDSGKSPNFPPAVEAGTDRVVVSSGTTLLEGTVKDDGKRQKQPRVTWSTVTGPGVVRFENAHATSTSASFSELGEYLIQLSAEDGEHRGVDSLAVRVEPPFPERHLTAIPLSTYKIGGPLWKLRMKKVIEHWLPHCYNRMSDLELKEGGIYNFIQAGNKLAGRPYSPAKGAVFANGWVYNMVESLCLALMIDPQGDEGLIQEQKSIRKKLDEWIPYILSAQEPDGYLQTFYTLNNLRRWNNRADHEGYLAGYFMEAAIAHFSMTQRQDTRMYEAAKRLADCWCKNIGPGKRTWFDGHQALEMALVRLGRLVNEVEDGRKGQKYIELAKFLLDCRKGGEEYDQSHVPVIQQYEAVGHSVRAVYSYAAMVDIAMEMQNIDYQSAVKSIWDNLVHKKYYVTGGVGSGETSEGFGKDYSLPNNAYCESCAGCGELFFQHRLNLACQETKYADLYEESLFNAILGSLDFEANNFTYTNPLDSRGARYAWHVCPCCVGNIPRTLFMLPTWMYAKDDKNLYVNLFADSEVSVGKISDTEVQVIQKTDYPWSGKVSITMNPKKETVLGLHIRIPDRNTSKLYTNSPAISGVKYFAVNGVPVELRMMKGYAYIERQWKPNDKIEIEFPMEIQRIKADYRIKDNVGKVALRCGPIIYNFESTDQNLDSVLHPQISLKREWKPDLLGGIMVITGKYENGSPLMAIPNYSRNNRGGRSTVWMRE